MTCEIQVERSVGLEVTALSTRAAAILIAMLAFGYLHCIL